MNESEIKTVFNVGDPVEIVFDYFTFYPSIIHRHSTRQYFSIIKSIVKRKNGFVLYSLEDFNIVFIAEDLKSV